MNTLFYYRKLNPLDSTLIHPESYDLASDIIEGQGFDVKKIGTPEIRGTFQEIEAGARDSRRRCIHG